MRLSILLLLAMVAVAGRQTSPPAGYTLAWAGVFNGLARPTHLRALFSTMLAVYPSSSALASAAFAAAAR